MLEFKINVNLPRLLCIVVSVALNGEFERFGGLCVDLLHDLLLCHPFDLIRSEILICRSSFRPYPFGNFCFAIYPFE